MTSKVVEGHHIALGTAFVDLEAIVGEVMGVPYSVRDTSRNKNSIGRCN